MDTRLTSRRAFLKVAASTAGAGLLAAQGASGPLHAQTAVAASVRSGARIEKSGVLWGLQYQPHVAAYHRLAALFHQETGSTINIQPQPWPLEPKLIAALAAGTGPDVACILGGTAVPLYVQKVLRPLDALVFQAKHIDPAKQFVGDSLAAFQWRNQILGVPVESNAIGSPVSVPVNDVTALGMAAKYPPTNGQVFFKSYPDMWQVAKALQVTRNGRVVKHGLSSAGWEYQSLFGIMRSLGTPWWDESTKKFHLDSAAGVQAMDLLVAMPVKMGIEVPLPAGQNAGDAAIAGKVAICRGNTGPALQGQALGVHYEACGAPDVIPGKDPLFTGEGGWGFAAFKNARNPGLAIAFVQMMATQKAQLAYGKIYNGVPFFAWRELTNDTTRFANPSPTSPEVKAAAVYAKIADRTVFFGHEYGYYLNIQNASGAAVTAVRSGHMSSAAAMKGFQAAAEAQYKQYLTDVSNLG